MRPLTPIAALSPFALKRERGPIIRRLPLPLPPHFDLRRAQGRRRSLTILEHFLVELRHQLRGGFVIDAPEADHNARRPGVHKPARQSHQSFAFDLFAEARLAGAQHDQFGGQIQVVDFVRAQKPILWGAPLVNQCQDQSRKARAFAVQQPVCGEMQITITAKLRPGRRSAIGSEIERFQIGACGRGGQYAFGLLPRER